LGHRRPKAVLHELCLVLTRGPALDYESAAVLPARLARTASRNPATDAPA
jgi:hypothetical protein